MRLIIFCLAPVSLAVPNFHGCVAPEATSLPYCNHTLSIDERLSDLVDRLSLEEKIGLISPAEHTPTLSKGVPRHEKAGMPPGKENGNTEMVRVSNIFAIEKQASEVFGHGSRKDLP